MTLAIELRATATADPLEWTSQAFERVAWVYDRVGGCGTFTLEGLTDRTITAEAITGAYDCQLKLDGVLVYRGKADVPNKSQSEVHDRPLAITGEGYRQQLENSFIDKIYQDVSCGAIITDIMSNVAIKQDITFAATGIAATGVIASNMEIRGPAIEGIRQVAEFVGNVEWGVNRNLEFFFLAKSSNVNFTFDPDPSAGEYITGFESTPDYRTIKNVIYLLGGAVQKEQVDWKDDTQNERRYMKKFSNNASIAAYGIREVFYENNAITTDADAAQWAAAVLPTITDPRLTISFMKEQLATALEITSFPLGLADVENVGHTNANLNITGLQYTHDLKGLHCQISLGQYRRDIGFIGAGKGPKTMNETGRTGRESGGFGPAGTLKRACGYINGLDWDYPADYASNPGAIIGIEVDGLPRNVNSTADVTFNDPATNQFQLQRIQPPSDAEVIMIWKPKRGVFVT